MEVPDSIVNGEHPLTQNNLTADRHAAAQLTGMIKGSKLPTLALMS